jgi:hypothetical protein
MARYRSTRASITVAVIWIMLITVDPFGREIEYL